MQKPVRPSLVAVVDWDQLLATIIDRGSCRSEGGGSTVRPDDSQLAPLRRWLRFQLAASLGPALRRKLDESDVVQQSMLDLWIAMETFRGRTTAELQEWLLTLARRNVVDAARRYRDCQSRDVRRERSLDSTASRSSDWFGDDLTASGIAVRQESDDELAASLSTLSTLRREILIARHRDGLSFSQIAADHSMTSAAVRNLYRRGLDQVRTLMRSSDGHDARR